MSIALFYITSCCITYLTAIVLTNVLVRDMTANKELTKHLLGDSRRRLLRVFLIPIFNIILVLMMAYIVYSYHQYTLGKTDYNIFKEEGEWK
jgi:type VI protein secretion system component VasF